MGEGIELLMDGKDGYHENFQKFKVEMAAARQD